MTNHPLALPVEQVAEVSLGVMVSRGEQGAPVLLVVRYLEFP